MTQSIGHKLAAESSQPAVVVSSSTCSLVPDTFIYNNNNLRSCLDGHHRRRRRLLRSKNPARLLSFLVLLNLSRIMETKTTQCIGLKDVLWWLRWRPDTTRLST